MKKRKKFNFKARRLGKIIISIHFKPPKFFLAFLGFIISVIIHNFISYSYMTERELHPEDDENIYLQGLRQLAERMGGNLEEVMEFVKADTSSVDAPEIYEGAQRALVVLKSKEQTKNQS